MTTHTTSPAKLGVLAQHQAQLGQGLLHIQKCQACHQHIYFPREICPHCGGHEVAFVTPSGLGTVYAVTTVRRKAAEGGHSGAQAKVGVCYESGKGVAKHAEEIIAALDHLRAPENAIMAAARGLLVQWPECLPRGVHRCPALHEYLDKWT